MKMDKKELSTNDKFLIDRIVVNVREFLEEGYQDIAINKGPTGFTICPTRKRRVRNSEKLSK